jgi:class 3 adenylate cyclase
VQSVLTEEARIVKELGDGLLMWFPDPAGALHSAFALNVAARIVDVAAPGEVLVFR